MSVSTSALRCRHGKCWRHDLEPPFQKKFELARHEKIHHPCTRRCEICAMYPHEGPYRPGRKRANIESAIRNVAKIKASEEQVKKRKLSQGFASGTSDGKSPGKSCSTGGKSPGKSCSTGGKSSLKSSTPGRFSSESTLFGSLSESPSSSNLLPAETGSSLMSPQSAMTIVFAFIDYFRDCLFYLAREISEKDSGYESLMPANQFYHFVSTVCPGLFEFQLLMLAPETTYGKAKIFSNLNFGDHRPITEPVMVPRRTPRQDAGWRKQLQYVVIKTLNNCSFRQVKKLVGVCRSRLVSSLVLFRRSLNAELKDLSVFAWAKGVSQPLCNMYYHMGLGVSYSTLIREREKRASVAAGTENWKLLTEEMVKKNSFLTLKFDNFTHVIGGSLFSSKGLYKCQELITVAGKVAQVPFIIPVMPQLRDKTVELRDFDNVLNEGDLVAFVEKCSGMYEVQKYRWRADKVSSTVVKEGHSGGRLEHLVALDALKLSTNKAVDYPVLLQFFLDKIEAVNPGYATTNIIPLCVDIQCYEILEKLFCRLPRNHRFQVFFPVNDFFHVHKQYIKGVFESYHKLFFAPACRVMLPSGHAEVFVSPSLAHMIHICTIIQVAYNSDSGLLRRKLRKLGSPDSPKRHDVYVSSLVTLLEEHIPRIVFGFRNVEGETADVDKYMEELVYYIGYFNHTRHSTYARNCLLFLARLLHLKKCGHSFWKAFCRNLDLFTTEDLENLHSQLSLFMARIGDRADDDAIQERFRLLPEVKRLETLVNRVYGGKETRPNKRHSRKKVPEDCEEVKKCYSYLFDVLSQLEEHEASIISKVVNLNNTEDFAETVEKVECFQDDCYFFFEHHLAPTVISSAHLPMGNIAKSLKSNIFRLKSWLTGRKVTYCSCRSGCATNSCRCRKSETQCRYSCKCNHFLCINKKT